MNKTLLRCGLVTLAGALALSGPAVSSDTATAAKTEPGAESGLDEKTRRRADSYYHLMSGVLLAAEGQVPAAVEELERAIEIEPASADLRAEVAVLLWSMGRSADSERHARKALEMDPENERALRHLAGMVRYRAQARGSGGGSVFEALTLYERLVQLPGAKPEDLYALTRLKLGVGDLDGAAESARELADLRVGDPQAVRLLVRVLLTADRQDEALETLLSFLGDSRELSGPDLEETVAMTAELTRARQAWERFLSHADAILAAHPEVGELYALRGEALLQSGKIAEAAGALETALELSEDEPILKMHLATVYASTGRLADASVLARELSVEFPDHPRVATLLGEVLAEQGDSAGAIEALSAAVVNLENGPEEDSVTRDLVRRRIAGLHILREEYAEAEKVLGTLDEPGTTESLEMRARLALETGRPGEAREYAQRIRSLGDAASGDLIEGEAWILDGKPEKAWARFDAASEAYGKSVWARAADLYRSNGRPEAGEELLRRWVEEKPEDADARFYLGAFLERVGRFEEGEPELREAIRLQADHAEALNHLGYTLAERDEKLAEAHGFIQRALEMDPWNGAYLDSLGWVLYRLGRFAEALEPLERAARELPTDATVLEHLGDVYSGLGDGDRAVLVWERALKQEPERADRIRAKIASQENAPD